MSFENSSPIIEQPAPSDLSFLVPGNVTITVGQIVYISAAGTIAATTGPQDFVGIVKSIGTKSSIYGNYKATVTCGKAKIRYKSSGVTTPGDQLVSGNNGTLQTLAAAAAGDEGTASNIATSVNNHSIRKAICDTGATDGNIGIAILL